MYLELNFRGCYGLKMMTSFSPQLIVVQTSVFGDM